MLSFIMHYYTFFIVLLGSLILGLLSGVLGVFAVLHRKSLLADAIAHAALPGIVVMFLFTLSKDSKVLLLGGCVTALIALGFEYLLSTTTALAYDAILGIILSVFFGIGLVLITHAQKFSLGNQGLIQRFVFGNAALLSPDDIFFILWVSIIIFLVLVLCWRQLIMLTFDPLYTRIIGYSTTFLRTMLLCLFIIVILLGLQTMGVILMSTLLVAPASGVRPWVNSVETQILAAGIFAAIACCIGTILSMHYEHLPTGPAIVVVLVVSVLVSIVIHKLRYGDA